MGQYIAPKYNLQTVSARKINEGKRDFLRPGPISVVDVERRVAAAAKLPRAG